MFVNYSKLIVNYQTNVLKHTKLYSHYLSHLEIEFLFLDGNRPTTFKHKNRLLISINGYFLTC